MRKITFILFALISLISCKKDNQGNLSVPKMESFPMTIGTEWTYDRQVLINKYDLADNIIKIDTFNYVVRFWIEKDTVLNDTMKVTAFKSQENGIKSISTHYKFIDKNGLKTYAYNIPGGVYIFRKENGSPNPTFDIYNNLRANNKELTISNEIKYEEIPTLDIKLPLYENESWTYRYYKTNPVINKKVVGYENVNLIGQNFYCYKVDLINPILVNGKSTDWISDKGLIKRLTVYDKQLITDASGSEPTGSYQTIETLTLKELKIK